MLKVTWDQVLGWRLGRQFVDPPGGISVAEVVGRLVGVQAQVASAAEMAVGLRLAVPDPAGSNAASPTIPWSRPGPCGPLHVLRAAIPRYGRSRHGAD